MKRCITKPTRGFTLIELLTVIAIIGILSGILVPAVGAAKKAAMRAQTKSQLSTYVMSIENYRQEYGYYPPVNNGNAFSENAVNLANGNNCADLIKALTGRDPNSGAALTGSDRTRFNKKLQEFHVFTEKEFERGSRTKLVDAFDNPNIWIAVDHDGDGLIKAQPLPGLTEGADSDWGGSTNPVRARVVAFVVRGGANIKAPAAEGYQTILTWE